VKIASSCKKALSAAENKERRIEKLGKGRHVKWKARHTHLV